jgi:hypothetical protein
MATKGSGCHVGNGLSYFSFLADIGSVRTKRHGNERTTELIFRVHGGLAKPLLVTLKPPVASARGLALRRRVRRAHPTFHSISTPFSATAHARLGYRRLPDAEPIPRS